MNAQLEGLASLVSKYHKAIVAAWVVFGVVATLFVVKLELKTDLMDVLPADDPKITPFKEFLADFGSMDNLVVVVESSGVESSSKETGEVGDILVTLDAVEALADALAASELVEYVDYRVVGDDGGLFLKYFPLFLGEKGLHLLAKKLSPKEVARQLKKNRLRLLSPFSSPEDTELISKDPLNLRSVFFRTLLKDSPYGRTGYFTDKDGTVALLFVKPARSSHDVKFLQELEGELGRIFKEVVDGSGGSVKIGLTGPFAYTMEAHSTLKRELMRTFAATLVAVFLLFQFVYRKRFLVLVLLAATLASSLAAALAAAYLLFGGLNIASSVVAVMLLGLGIDYVIHAFNRMEEEYADTASMDSAIRAAFTHVMPAVATSAAATAIAFFSIIVTDFRGLYEMGIVAGIGVLSCLVSTLLFMTSATALCGPRVFSPKVSREHSLRLITFVIEKRGAVLTVASLLLLVSAFFITKLTFDSAPESMGLKVSPAFAVEKKVSSTLGKKRNPLMAVVSAETDDELLTSYDALEGALTRLKASSAVASYSSLSDFIPPLSMQRLVIESLRELRTGTATLEDDFIRGLRENGFTVTDYNREYIRGIAAALSIDAPLTLSNLDSSDRSRARLFYNPDKHKAAAYLFSDDGAWSDETTQAVAKEIDSLGDSTILTGASIMFATLKGAIIKESVVAAIGAFIFITALLYLHFRSIRWVLLVLVPLNMGLVYTLGVMGAAGISFNYINVGAATLIVGIGVDYGIYMVHGYVEGGRNGLARSWRSVLMCALTSIVGFSSLAFMSFQGIASLGYIITIGIGSCLFAAFTILPAAA